MRFILPIPIQNVYYLMRKCAYTPDKITKKSELVFFRSIGSSRSGYPRFHLYVKSENKNSIFNLHLDQKRPIYKGVRAHGGEYEGEVVEKEVNRIKDTYLSLGL